MVWRSFPQEAQHPVGPVVAGKANDKPAAPETLYGISEATAQKSWGSPLGERLFPGHPAMQAFLES